MCTLTVYRIKDEIIITMNRDESRDRPEKNQLFQAEGLSYPIDTRSGGTWIGCNQHGVAMALLNRYQDKSREDKTSRGVIIPILLQSKNISLEIPKLMEQGFNPFDLILYRQKKITQYSWNGNRLAITNKKIPFFISSSSVDYSNTIHYRHQEFLNLEPDSNCQVLEKLHFKQDNKNKSKSVFMARKATHTKSITQIIINKQKILMQYYTEEQVVKFPLSNRYPKIVELHYS